MAENNPQQSPKILCVDDEDDIRQLCSEFLRHLDYEVKTAADAREAWTIAKSFEPDLIVSDVVMPDVSGFEFCRKIKKEKKLARAIFILMSGQRMDPVHTLEGIDAGADDYLFKPFSQDEFVAKIKAFIRIKFLQDDLSKANRKLNKAIRILKDYKLELEEKNTALMDEKVMLQNSLKQISLMVSDREKTNLELERLNEIHKKDINSLISILLHFIETKRQYHRGHSRKIAKISSFIAQEVELPPEEIEHIKSAALLHEIGKLSIPEELAMKNPNQYTQQEIDFLIQHPVRGAKILEQFSGFEKVSKIIRHFHEHFDGTGVPDGLEGERIPMGSRIIAIANLFDNLVYRNQEISTEEAFAILEEGMGSKFDPSIGYQLHKYAHAHPVDEDSQTKEVRILELMPGMVLASGIFTLSGTKLLPINTVITEDVINQIAQYNKLEPIEEIVFIKN